MACLLCAAIALGTAAFATAARAAGIDGISDQSLAAWDGDFARSALAAALRAPLPEGAPPGGIAYARYVVQWDALGGVGAADPAGYGPRFEAWLADAASLRLAPVVALTSYDGAYPQSQAAYAAGLRAVLERAAALGHPLAYIEPWNEPNNQGAATAATAAAWANTAHAVCAVMGCAVIAGDFADRAGSSRYAREYARALTFTPSDWGVHPYASVATRDPGPLLALRAALPAGGIGARLWITEVAALACTHGEILGEARQARDAAFLVSLARDPRLAPAHVFYYGLMFRDRALAPCTRAGGEDGELFRPDGTPRPAAAIVFPALAGEGLAAAFGPGPVAVG